MAKKTRWTAAETVAIARAEHGAASRYGSRLSDRGITSAFLAQLARATDASEAASSGQPVRLGAQKGSTAALDELLAKAQRSATAACNAIRRRLPDRKDVQKVYGVGGSAALTVPAALAAIDAVVLGAAQFPTESTAAGILPRDQAALAQLRLDILGANTAQEGAKGSAKGATASKDDLLRDLTRRVDQMLAAAELEFAHEPAILAEFRGPLPTKGKKRGGAKPAP